MNFWQRLKENDYMQYAYKSRHQGKYIWIDKHYIIQEETNWLNDIILLYSKRDKFYPIIDTLEKDWRIVEEEKPESDILMQCKLFFEYDCFAELRRLNKNKFNKIEDFNL